MISMCSLQILDAHPQLARDLRDLMVLQQPQVLGDDLLGRRAFEPEVADLQPQAFLQVARGDADRIERLHVLQRPLDVGDRPLPHRGDLFDRRDEIAVVVEVADDRAADLFEPVVVGLQRELPEQVIGERARRRERVLDRRELLDLGRGARAVAVVEVVAEEVLVVGVVPGVGLSAGCLSAGLLRLLLLGRLELLGRDFLEQRVLDHLLVQQVGQLERRHRQQLDRLLQRRRQDELLNEFGVEFLLNRHESSRPFPSLQS